MADAGLKPRATDESRRSITGRGANKPRATCPALRAARYAPEWAMSVNWRSASEPGIVRRSESRSPGFERVEWRVGPPASLRACRASAGARFLGRLNRDGASPHGRRGAEAPRYRRVPPVDYRSRG